MPHATINGARLWYQQYGSGEPIILHHGYTACRDNWMPVVDYLSKAYQVTLMECRGAGESEDTDDGYSLQQYAADVVGMADHLGLSTFTYAGHSMGGGVGYVLAVDHVERLSRLVLMAPVYSDGFELADNEYRTRVQNARATDDRDGLLKVMMASAFHKADTESWFRSRVHNVMRVSDGHLMDGLISMSALRLADKLPEIITPTLMLAATADGLLPANLADYQQLPNVCLQVFSHAGHDIALHEPDGVARAIDQFMQQGVITPAVLAAKAAAGQNAAD